MTSHQLRTIALSTLPLDARESLLFSLASEIDPNNLHFSLLPDADNPNRDPETPVVAVTWKVPRQHPVLARTAALGLGTEVPQYPEQHGISSEHENVVQNNRHVNGTNHPSMMMSITPRKTATSSRAGTIITKRTPSPRQRARIASNSPITVEEILTVSPVIRGSPTPFVPNMFRKNSPYSKASPYGRLPPRSSSSNDGQNNNNINNINVQPRSPQWAQRYIEEFLHFAAKSGVDTVQHNSIAFALQCFLQYQSAVAATIRADFADLQVAVESYNHVCPATKLLHFLWKECDDFSGVACLSYLASIRFNDQVVAPRQIISLTSKVRTVAGHLLLINRKYLRLNECVAVLRQATRRWNMHASAFAKRHILHFLKSHRDPENAIAFDYLRHVDFYSFLLQLGRCYVATNAGRNGGPESGVLEPSSNQQHRNQNPQGHYYQYEEINDESEVDPEQYPEKVGGNKFQQHELYQQNGTDDGFGGGKTPRISSQQQQQQLHNNERREVSVSPNTPAPLQQQQQQQQQIGGIHGTSPIPKVPYSQSSYALRFEEQRFQRQGQHQNRQPQQYQDPQSQQTIFDTNNPSRSAAWVKRIDSAQQALEQVMRQFESVKREVGGGAGSSKSPSPSSTTRKRQMHGDNGGINPHAYLRGELVSSGSASPTQHSMGRMRTEIVRGSSQSASPRPNPTSRNQQQIVQQQQIQPTVASTREATATATSSSNRHLGETAVVEDTVVVMKRRGNSNASRSASQDRQQYFQPPTTTAAAAAAAMSMSNPRARSDQPPKEASLDPESAALAEEVRKALEIRQQQQQQKSKLEMLSVSSPGE